MNSKQKLMALAWILAFVAVAAFVSVRSVAAEHGEAPIYRGVSSLRRFQLYMWALEQSGSDHTDTAAAPMSNPDPYEKIADTMGWTPEEFLQRSGVGQ